MSEFSLEEEKWISELLKGHNIQTILLELCRQQELNVRLLQREIDEIKKVAEKEIILG